MILQLQNLSSKSYHLTFLYISDIKCQVLEQITAKLFFVLSPIHPNMINDEINNDNEIIIIIIIIIIIMVVVVVVVVLLLLLLMMIIMMMIMMMTHLVIISLF